MDKLSGMSLDIEKTTKAKLQAVFPECFNEGKLDIDKLLNLCGEYIDEDFEKYKFEWKGKAECFKIAGRRSTGTLRPCPDESVNFDTTKNIYIEGDNLEVLKLLQTAYFRKVKMIYIDPPYNTGNDFVYNDDFVDPISHYKEITSQATKSNPESMGRFHTAWLNMMYPRLRLAHNLLRDEGLCFISIDDNEVGNLRKLCDEIFGEENFIAQIVWEKLYTVKNDSSLLSNNHEYVFFYAKNINAINLRLLPRTDEMNARYTNTDNDPRGEWKAIPLYARGERTNGRYAVISPSTGKEHWPPADSHWRYRQADVEQLVADNRIYFGKDGNAQPALKRFVTEVQQGIKASSLWKFSEVGSNDSANRELKDLFDGTAPFSFPKPSTLVKQMLHIATEKDDIILDFFSGSATTAHAVMQLNAEDGGNRRFIMVQLPEVIDEKSEAHKTGYKNICEIGKERIRRAGAKLLTEHEDNNAQLTVGGNEPVPLDVGFRVFKLDTSNFHAWDGTPISDGNMQTLWDRFDAREKTIKRDRTDLDIVFEVMLKMGIPLDYVVSKIAVGERKCYSIGERPFETSKDCMILVCLDFGITPEDITAFCDLAPAKIIAAEEAFEDSTAMSNAHYILRDRDIEMKLL